MSPSDASMRIDAQLLETLPLSAIVVAELRFGVPALPVGQRRDGLDQGLEHKALPLFAGSVLPFDLAASHAHAEMMARTRSAGLASGCRTETLRRQQQFTA